MIGNEGGDFGFTLRGAKAGAKPGDQGVAQVEDAALLFESRGRCHRQPDKPS
jgi:hypothetical protein